MQCPAPQRSRCHRILLPPKMLLEAATLAEPSQALTSSEIERLQRLLPWSLTLTLQSSSPLSASCPS
jgi:hypothetical protein